MLSYYLGYLDLTITVPLDFTTSPLDLHSFSNTLDIIKWNHSVSQAHTLDCSGSSFQADDAQSLSQGMPLDTFQLEDDSLLGVYSDYAQYNGGYTFNNGILGTGMGSDVNPFTPGYVFVQECSNPLSNGQLYSHLPGARVAASLESPAPDVTRSMQTVYENMDYYSGEPASSIEDFHADPQSNPYSTYTFGNDTPFDPSMTNPSGISNYILPNWQSKPTNSKPPFPEVHDTYWSEGFLPDGSCTPVNDAHVVGYRDLHNSAPPPANRIAAKKQKTSLAHTGPISPLTLPCQSESFQNWTRCAPSPISHTKDPKQPDNQFNHVFTSFATHCCQDGPGTEGIIKLTNRRPSNFTSASGPESPNETNELQPSSTYCVKSETHSTAEPEAEPARTSPHYEAHPHSDGLYYCPFKSEEDCLHEPTKLKCNYDKYVDSHLKPYRCKVTGCQELRFSSTACRLRHEREAHGSHGHGVRPYLCLHADCERSKTGNGFPRSWNRNDHMKRVHDHTIPSGDSTGSPPFTSSEASTFTDMQIIRKRKAPEEVHIETEKRHKAPMQGQGGFLAYGSSTELTKAYEMRKSMQSQWRDCHAVFHHRFHSLRGPQDFQALEQLRVDADALYAMSRQLHQLG